MKRTTFIFPDGSDIMQDKYASSNCSINGNNSTTIVNSGLCVCRPGYEFVQKTSSCRKIIFRSRLWNIHIYHLGRITPKWENNVFEYGVCTRINSQGQAREERDICPWPLSCQPRQDKYVCSCGQDKYLDEANNTCRKYSNVVKWFITYKKNLFFPLRLFLGQKFGKSSSKRLPARVDTHQQYAMPMFSKWFISDVQR